MSRLFFVFILLFVGTSFIYSQLSEGGTPPGFSLSNVLKSSVQPQVVEPGFDLSTLLKEDSLDAEIGAPLRFGCLIPVAFDLQKDGQTLAADDGLRLLSLSIQAPGAIATMLYYDEFYIPEGGRLFIYNQEKTAVLGAYTHQTNPQGREFATELLPGDAFIVEYVFPKDGKQTEPRIRISDLGYGYNHLDRYRTESRATGFGSSQNCEVNVNCPEGDNWQDHKKGVARMSVRIGSFIYFCTGSLVNNTSEELIPYFLSAHHCFYDNSNTQANFSQILFYFHYELAGCDASGTEPKAKTLTGAELLVDIPLAGGSDGALLRLSDNVPESYDVFYNGWDVNNTAPSSGVGIHHPSGDVKKISTYTSSATSTTWNGQGGVGATRAHWDVRFAKTANGHGVTEGGSSGSPLFNPDGRIVGTLSGGTSTCAQPSGSNLYGKLWYHWDQATQQMSSFLDPGNTGARVLNGRYHGVSRVEFRADDQDIYTGDSVRFENLSSGTSQFLWSFPGGSPLSSTETSPTVHYHTAGEYEVVLTANPGTVGEQSDTLRYIAVKERPGTLIPNTLSATYNTENTEVVDLSWDVYVDDVQKADLVRIGAESFPEESASKSLSWYTGSPYYIFGLTGAGTFSVFSSWKPSDLMFYREMTIKSLSLVVSDQSSAGDYTLSVRLKILQDGEEVYSQDIPSITYNKVVDVALTTPVQVDLSKSLMFGYELSQSAAGNPVFMDNSALIETRNVVHLNNQFNYLENLLDDPGNLCVAALVEVKEYLPYTFNVYRDGILLASGLRETVYSDTVASGGNGEHCYQVSTSFRANGTESRLSDAVCLSSGSSSADDDVVKVYTLPLEGILSLECSKEIQDVTISDSSGMLIYRLMKSGTCLKIDTRMWPSGVYLLTVRTAAGRSVHKVVK